MLTDNKVADMVTLPRYTTWHLAPGTWHSDKVVSRILIEPYLLVEEVDGSNHLENSKEVPNLYP